MKSKVYVIKKENQEIYFGFIGEHPAVCAQGNSLEELSNKIKRCAELYFSYMCENLEIDTNELISM